MADDRRLNIDLDDDLEAVKNNLLRDVAAATEAAKQRQASDKARDAELQSKSKDKMLMTIIIAVAAVLILGLAYWMVFARGDTQPADSSNSGNRPSFSIPAPGGGTTSTPPAGVQPPSVRPQPAPHPSITTPRSEPVHRNPSDTYDEGADSGADM